MNREWPVTHVVRSIEEFAERLSTFSTRKELVYRGQVDTKWYLRASLDRNVRKSSSYADRLKEERRNEDWFRGRATRFLGTSSRAIWPRIKPTG
jgi:hypothetical protein